MRSSRHLSPSPPLIDPNQPSCGSVPRHGVVELAHPEKEFFIVGMKSCGRAPTFLMAAGYEQVRSIAAELAGDFAAAGDVRLILPETGVCWSDRITGPATACCGGLPAPQSDACCQLDLAAKSAGADGCGCSATSAGRKVPAALPPHELPDHETAHAPQGIEIFASAPPRDSSALTDPILPDTLWSITSGTAGNRPGSCRS